MATLCCPRTTCLRSLSSTSRSLTIPVRIFLTFATWSRPSKPEQQQQHQQTRPQVTRPDFSVLSRLPNYRFVSARNSSTASVTSKPAPENVLTWNHFFNLKRKRSRLNLGCSVLSAAGSVGLATPIIAQQDFDSWGAQISGLDPMMVFGMTTFAVAAGGWLLGPAFGNIVFSFWARRRGWKQAIAEKEKSFYARIKRYRADPAESSPQSPIPDYYGEKIGSVQGYRRWLKDQRAFKLKRKKNFV